MKDRWGAGPDTGGDLAALVHLARCVGADPRLVQPGGGNCSVKTVLDTPVSPSEDVLLVKGSGHDLRSVGPEGFTRLSIERLGTLRDRNTMDDETMMDILRACMLHPHTDPFPSVETPLHAFLPHRVILHTHDIATLGLTDLPAAASGALIEKIYGDRLTVLPYARPGWPLARLLLDRLPEVLDGDRHGVVLSHHGLVVWADTPEQCYRRLCELIDAAEGHESARRAMAVSDAAALHPAADALDHRAAILLPVIRGALSGSRHLILHRDISPEILDFCRRPDCADLCRRGMATPDHILWAGPRPLVVPIDFDSPKIEWISACRLALQREREVYVQTHRRHATAGQAPLDDWARAVLVPGLGLVSAGTDGATARTAAACTRATLEVMQSAEAIARFEGLSPEDMFEFEHWPLERRKLEDLRATRQARQLLPGRVALIFGAASGIGAAAAERFAREGAHVVCSDLDGAAAGRVAAAIGDTYPGRAIGLGTDVCDDGDLRQAVTRTVLTFGGLDIVFYTAGRAPTFSRIVDLTREDLQAQLDVHYLGALLALREAGRVLRRQGLGGAVIGSVSKAALAPGKDAAAYGGSKAALQHALRIAALEFGEDDIRVNAINADQVDTPLFRRFVAARAQSAGRSIEEQLDRYRQRNALGRSLIPAGDVAEMAVLLASDRFAHTTGDILTIDGGLPDAFPR
ncbi:MAG: SDR family oxidoreductase [Acidobacteriota bacterium]